MNTLILLILFLHFLGDFVLQNDWMAQNKSHSMKPLLTHIGIYTATMAAGLMLYPMMDGYSFGKGGLWAVLYALANGLIHLGVDFVTSRINSRLWKAGRVHAFFVSVGFDQFLHYAALLLTAGILQ